MGGFPAVTPQNTGFLMFMSRQNHTRHLENCRLPDINSHFSGVPHISLVWSAEQVVSSERGIFSESKARGGRESGFATDEQHRNREKDPLLAPTAKRLTLHFLPEHQKSPSVRRAAPSQNLPQLISFQ
jgi:hypothetical protein